MKRYWKWIALALVGLCAVVFVLTLVFPSSPTEESSTPTGETPLGEELLETARAEVLTANSPTLTPTFVATETLVPTATPEPIRFNGAGDTVLDVVKGEYPAIIHITGNAGANYFGVTNYGAGNVQIGLLVNTTEPYDGVRPLDFGSGELTTRLEITATGDWAVEILPVSMARRLAIPGIIEGSGDDVFVLEGIPDTAIINGNAGARYFGVFAWGGLLGSDLLVNTTEPYSGTVLLSAETLVIEVIASGTWTIEITTAP